MSEQFDHATDLWAQTHEAGLQFLRTELRTALSLLDIVDHSDTGDSTFRRTALAHDAYNVVSEYLTRGRRNAFELTPEEREELSKVHEELGRRLNEKP